MTLIQCTSMYLFILVSYCAPLQIPWEALSSVISSVPKDVLPLYIKLVCDVFRHAGRISSNTWFLPPESSLPFFLQGLISGSAEFREQAAFGVGELIDETSEQALKEFVIPITGSLIRIIGDRFPFQVKSANSLNFEHHNTEGSFIRIIGDRFPWQDKSSILPQLQTTFVKCLQDITRTVRSSAALALGKLSALTTRIDPLQASDVGIREDISSPASNDIR
ncbi:PREDICTED: eIF-2-alpha kinase activator gcn1-like [Ipomoea nil]|uniref:eIF-2-alpha kinase activator gcn1-like n=1 Tax=Ipomoea nil TaxID=35883 RepID=UPI000900E611|nr:PREDICTED: eIF-2-alpha kinase activator gcn1-like [Ipomoea nil]